MFKKIMSFMLAVMMIMSVAVMATSAAQVEIADNSAEAVAQVAADAAADTGADGGAETGAANTISFNLSSTTWNNSTYVSFHIWEYGQDPFYAWGSKKEKGKDAGNGIWTYDLDAAGITIESGKQYCVIFYNNNLMQTYDLLFDASCIGDTAACTGVEYENPVDSNKKGLAAFWGKADKSVCGPVLCISSIGNVVGDCLPASASKQTMFETFLKDTLTNAKTFSGKDDQAIIDDTAAALGLKIGNVEEAIKNSGVKVEWKADKSSLAEGTDDSAKDTGSGNSGGGSGSGSGTGTDSGSGSGTGTATGSGSGSSSTKTGSGSSTQTGQESTVLFIMFAVMIAAGAVIVIAKKRDRA